MEGQAAHWVQQEPRESQPGRAGSFSPPCQPPGTDRPPKADMSLPQVAGVRRLRGCAQPPDLRLPGLGDLPHHSRLLPRLLQRQGAPLPGAEAQDRVTGLAPGTGPTLLHPGAPREALGPLGRCSSPPELPSRWPSPNWRRRSPLWPGAPRGQMPAARGCSPGNQSCPEGVPLYRKVHTTVYLTLRSQSPSLRRQFGAWPHGPGCRAQTGSRREAVLHIHAAIYCTLSTLKYIYDSLHRAGLRLRVSGGLRSP